MMMIIGLLFMGLSYLASWKLKSKFKQYSLTPLVANLSGAEVAAKMLADNGIYDVKIISVEGQLSDHYNPQNRTVNLSHDVYYGRNAAAVAVSAHECGHAVQHAKAYSMLHVRSSLVPAVNFASQYMQWIILIGVFLVNTTPIPLTIGIALFSITTFFSFVTLPVEFDASRRALVWISNSRVITAGENAMAKDALKWAAMTYVIAALGSLAQLLYLIWMLLGRRD